MNDGVPMDVRTNWMNALGRAAWASAGCHPDVCCLLSSGSRGPLQCPTFNRMAFQSFPVVERPLRVVACDPLRHRTALNAAAAELAAARRLSCAAAGLRYGGHLVTRSRAWSPVSRISPDSAATRGTLILFLGQMAASNRRQRAERFFGLTCVVKSTERGL